MKSRYPSMSLFLLLIMLQLMRREHKHRDRDFNWGIAKTGSMNGLLKHFCKVDSDAILFSRPGQVSGGRQTGLQNRDPQHLHQARRSFARGSPICLPRSQWGCGPCLQVSEGTKRVNISADFYWTFFSVLFPKTWSEFVTCIKKYTSDCLTADQVRRRSHFDYEVFQ